MRSGFFRRSVIAAAGLLLGSLWSVPTASAQTSCVTDPVGDASVIDKSIVIAPYQDIIKACITLKGGRFFFVMDVAGPIPSSPALQPSVRLLDWSFRLNTDLATCPIGFPWAPGDRIHCAKFVLFVLWDGTNFTGILIDRRPALTGGQAVITPIPFEIQGAEITAPVDAAMVGNPPSFQWRATTDVWLTELGTEAFFQPDSAPDSGTATWPNN